MRKIKTPAGRMLFIVFIFALNFTAFAQNENYTAPVKWQNYSVKNKKVTFLMPKLPVVYQEGDQCRGEKAVTFGSYADGFAYLVRIVSKTDVADFCREKKNFDQKNFQERIEKLKNERKLTEFTDPQNTKSNELKLTGENQIYRLINDYENKRWFELQIYGYGEIKPPAEDFLNSLKINVPATGIEIGAGAERTLGDRLSGSGDQTPEPANSEKTDSTKVENENSSTASAAQKENTLPLKLVIKARARYTDSARQNGTQGYVVLKVIFLASGGIGAVSVVKKLPNGLTEQAVEAAKKMIFVPAQRNNRAISVVKTVEYGFSIY